MMCIPCLTVGYLKVFWNFHKTLEYSNEQGTPSKKKKKNSKTREDCLEMIITCF